MALQAAAIEPRVAAVVAHAPYRDLASAVRDRAPWATQAFLHEAFAEAERRARFRVSEVSPLGAAPRVRVPVLLVHGDLDHETPLPHSVAIHAALPGSRRLLVVRGAGHNDVLSRPAVWTAIADWIDTLDLGAPARPSG